MKFNGKIGEPTVRILRGTRMRSGDAAFNEMAAALQFPYYFGENWNAVSECLTDLAWMPACGYVVVVTAALELFADDLPQLESFARVCEHATRDWSEPIALGEHWDRPARSFHVVFQANEAEYAAMAERLGALPGAAVGTL